MITVEQFIPVCGCRSVGECTHEAFAELDALDALVDSFATEMKSKLRWKVMQGRHGWDDATNRDGIKNALLEHATRDSGQWVDVANFAAMLWNMEQPK